MGMYIRANENMHQNLDSSHMLKVFDEVVDFVVVLVFIFGQIVCKNKFLNLLRPCWRWEACWNMTKHYGPIYMRKMVKDLN